jgi:hypothetical protein
MRFSVSESESERERERERRGRDGWKERKKERQIDR